MRTAAIRYVSALVVSLAVTMSSPAYGQAAATEGKAGEIKATEGKATEGKAAEIKATEGDKNSSNSESLEARVSDLEEEVKKRKLPYWLGIGVGYGVAIDATDGDDNDASGLLVHVKGYPFRVSRKDPRSDTPWAWWQHLTHRLSFVAGLSVGDFNGAGLDGPVWVVGAGIDVVDEIAFVGGVGFYQFTKEVGGREDTDSGPYFAVSIDTGIFSTLVSFIPSNN